MRSEILTMPKIVKANSRRIEPTAERCLISEIWGSSDDDNVSIARAVVRSKISTAAHRLSGVNEIYLIAEGKGKVDIDGLEPTEVGVGDLIFIPANTCQRITNIGKTNLVFYCICTPKFTAECYQSEENGSP